MPLNGKLFTTIRAGEGMPINLLSQAVIKELNPVGKHPTTSRTANHSLLAVTSHVILQFRDSRINFGTTSPPTFHLQTSQILWMILHMPIKVLRHLPVLLCKVTPFPLALKRLEKVWQDIPLGWIKLAGS